MANVLEQDLEMLLCILDDSEAFAALETSWNTNKDFLELFSCAWEMEELQRNLPQELIRSDKSEAEAGKLRNEGNAAYKVKDLDKALQSYNRSIMTAPHPILTGILDYCDFQEDEDCLGRLIDPAAYGGVKDGVCVTLAKGYANRSAVLFELKFYEACLGDIEKSYECGYPKELSPKLELRRAKCISALRTDTSDKTPGSNDKEAGPGNNLNDQSKIKSLTASFAEVLGPLTLKDLLVSPQREAPMLDEPNPAIPALSNAVRVVHIPGKGRGLSATRDIATGEVLGVERAYCISINLENLQEYCATCLRRCLTPLPCPGCNRVIFCTEYCRAKGLSEEHWLECRILPSVEEIVADKGVKGLPKKHSLKDFTLLSMEEINTVNKCLVYKMLKNASINQLRNVFKKVTEVKHERPEDVGQNAQGLYKTNAYHALHHLCSNLDKQSIFSLTILCKFAVRVIKLLELSGRFFVDEAGVPITPSRKDAVLTGAFLVSHAVKLNYNPYEVVDLQLKRSVGAGVVPSLSLINHSCNPVTKHYNLDRYVVLRAIKPIKAGEDITGTYTPFFWENDKETRAKLLKKSFIKCTCIACSGNWPVYGDLPILALKCQRCGSEPVVPPNIMCPECMVKASPTQISQAELKARQAVVAGMGQEINEAIRIGIAMRDAIDISHDEFKLFCSSIDLLHEHVALPCKIMVDTEKVLLRILDFVK